ncbi:hypothetical protein EDD18DRAFT_1347189 [Armillaria luteobubalina]|uniref:Uncharacterized protein n=1 Tax=Armillaria luteobubalina TaxID=153913 RepID=A0AA39UTJ1_9AGAR|nr:hypothetical protein EDD18DRAFT_1347189 [Armillaria luteobubalina]
MSLCLGYHQVIQFGPDDDYEEEEGITYITLELGNVEPSLIPSCDNYHLVVNPFSARRALIQYNPGPGYSDIISTASWDSAQGSARDIVGYGTAVLLCGSYMDSTRQRICFREVRLEEKGKAKADVCQLVLNRITGKLAPLPRRCRTQKMEVVPKD